VEALTDEMRFPSSLTTESQIQLIVVPPPGVSSFTVVASRDTTIEQLMGDIAKRTSIPVAQQMLTHNGVSLPKTSTVNELRLNDGAQLSVTPTLVGGCGCECCTVL
jgi:hypothetical protein